MSTNTDPPRLIAGSSDVGRLLEAANQSYSEPADEPRAWQRFEAHYAATRDRTARRIAYVLVPLAAAAAYAIYAKKHTEPQPWAAADPAAVTITRSTADQAIAEESSSVRPALSGVHLPLPGLPSASSRSLDCQVALKQGPARDKATCLERIAAGNTLEAQRAVLELAKLKELQLQDPAGAANALRDYRKRFPDGALKGEVDFALLELLPKAGQAQDALRESEALLNTAWGRSRTSELRLMRGRVAQDQLGDLEQAIQELSYVKSEFGAVGDEATLRTAQCYERAGKRDQAKASYREYLARKGVTQAEFARERLRKLESAE